MIDRAQLVAEARTWVGTPFHHQGRVKGVGVDCAGLVMGVARACGIADVEITGYSHQPDEGVFLGALQAHLDPIRCPEALPGDVLTFWFGAQSHLALVTAAADGPTALVHAYAPARRVVEQPLDAAWRARLRGAWRFRGA